ncbi:hypothetical protein H6P81_016865 [Aristolochia fimbriata]|uniref:Transcription factor TFIIIC triple barrel domain-containing protein n=1 Tax=Aristolochia fimbriata TaxID=158543 RepID=A0AAV7DZI3_ARIFI|nr:hypothetical protein H6P81_016865 [Aristolochia fimbriata]
MDPGGEQNGYADEDKEEEEFVLLDLDEVCGQIDIPANCPYVLSDLNTSNPILIIGDKLKLIGEYQETVGTCYAFSEQEVAGHMHGETQTPEENVSMRKHNGADPSQTLQKQIRPIAQLHKILKFRLFSEDNDKCEGGKK